MNCGVNQVDRFLNVLKWISSHFETGQVTNKLGGTWNI